jgi:phage protein D
LLRDDLLGEHELSGEPVRNRDDGMVLLRAAMRENFLTTVTADGSTVGHPDLRSGAKVRIGGVGPIFNGTWFVTSTTHTLDDSGYLTQFSARRENTRAA